MRATAAVLVTLAGLAGAAPAAAQPPTGTIAYTLGAAPGGIATTALTGGPATPLVTGYAGPPSWSPDGSRLAYGWAAPGGDATQVRTIPAAGGAPTTIAANGLAPAWSPDGTRIAYVSTGRGSGVRVVAATGGRARTVATAPERGRSGFDWKAAWLPGDRIAYVQVKAVGGTRQVVSLNSVPASGGTPRRIPVQLPAGLVLTGDSLTVSPSGDTLATSVGPRPPAPLGAPQSLALIPVAGGAPTTIISGSTSGSFSPDGSMLCTVQGANPVSSTLAIVSTAGAPLLTPGITASGCAWRPVQG